MSSTKVEFPKGFFWGAASSSYQAEGDITNTDWAKASRESKVPLSDSGPDHYNRYNEDFDLAKSLGHNCHRISIEWARIEPDEGKFDQEAIEHYKKVLQALIDRGITPFVTIWHFTLPQWISDKGGVECSDFPIYFSRYARFIVSSLHEYCNYWATMNEPSIYASLGWLTGEWVPFKKKKLLLYFRIKNNLVKAHKEAYKAIKELDILTDVGIVEQNAYFHSDLKLWNKISVIFLNWINNYSFLNQIIKYLDSIGVNYYHHRYLGKKINVIEKNDMGWEIFPEGIYHVLVGLEKYKKPIYISEAGIADETDLKRSQYIKDLIYWMHKAFEKGVQLKGYMYWSLTDNYEWAEGYKKRFGLIAINYETKERIIRQSAFEYKKICEENYLILENIK